MTQQDHERLQAAEALEALQRTAGERHKLLAVLWDDADSTRRATA